ncbi:hypothetical protein K9M78_07300 [Candidatus Bipolaricaulota bacterium]|nr:hypothetical protein [Candidatus Bipolaricaulota bacterium]
MRFSLKLFGLLLMSGLLVSSLGAHSSAADEISPVVPSLASFILPGSGQLINDQPNKALTHFIIGVGIYSSYTFTFLYQSPLYRLVPVLNLAWSGYSAYDAYQVARGRRQSIFGSSLDLDSAETVETDLELASSPLTTSGPSREFSVSAVKGG